MQGRLLLRRRHDLEDDLEVVDGRQRNLESTRQSGGERGLPSAGRATDEQNIPWPLKHPTNPIGFPTRAVQTRIGLYHLVSVEKNRERPEQLEPHRQER